MLNQETKRRIDSARDILVGKVPDPKAQVEQITTALIYKFMDDMDTESEELGGKASFFVGDYEKYGWSKLLDPRLGGFERLNLYVEALLTMPQNPHLPQLFRNILKDAFLPYRDPETLNLFLKEINAFTYDHSEKLGDAFEYLLSVLGSQGDAGQFRTPRHIIDFIVEVLDPKKTETILDPACGTAGFLISGYKHILKQNSNGKIGDKLTPDEKTKLMSHFMGYDISPDMVRLSLTNMYLHGFQNPNIFEYDTLTSEERWDETYDVIMANPPFMSPKGGIRPHKRFSIPANRSEVLFVDYIAEHLNTHGRAGVIVPEGIIFQSGNAYKALRKTLVEKYLYAVVSLPAGIFQPYSGVKTSILLMDKQLAKKADTILFVKVENDGFDLGAQRRAIEKNDLTQALAILQQYKQALQQGEGSSIILDTIKISTIAIIAEKATIAKNGDYNLSGERYRQSVTTLNQEWPMVELGDVCEINPKKSELKAVSPETVVSFVPMSDLSENGMFFEIKQIKKLSEVLGGYTYFCNNDVLLAKVTPCFENGKAGIARDLKNKIGFGSSEFIVLRSSERILPGLVYHFVTSEKFREIGKSQMTGTGGLQRLPTSFISKFQIPLPPLDVQQQIVAELENYQKIIDGAKQVVENYKPAFRIDPIWDIIKLGDICDDFKNGVNFSREQVGRGTKFVNIKDVFSSGYIDNENLERVAITDKEIEKHRLKDNDLLFVRSSVKYEGVGFPSLVHINGNDLVFCGFIIKCSPNDKKVNPKYLLFLLRTEKYREKVVALSNRSNITNISQDNLMLLNIPLPPLNVQEKIVETIEQEQKLVEANKKLIEIFEQKIKDKIAEVWGTDISPNDDINDSSNGTLKETLPAKHAEILQTALDLN